MAEITTFGNLPKEPEQTVEQTSVIDTVDTFEAPLIEEAADVVEKPVPQQGEDVKAKPKKVVEKAAPEIKTEPIQEPKQEEIVAFEMEEPKAASEIETKQTLQGEKQEPIGKDFFSKLTDEQKDEILKDIGVNQFAIDLNRHIRKGGSSEDYITAKAMNWDKVPNEKLVKDEMRKQYPASFSDEKIDKLFNAEYKQSEMYDEDEKELGDIRLEAAGEILRQKRIAESAALKIPENVQQAQGQQQPDNSAFEALVSTIKDSEITKSVLSRKVVAINTGDGVYNVRVSNPEQFLDSIINPEASARLIMNDKGEPNVQLITELGLYKSNPEGFKKFLISIGETRKEKEMVTKNQNLSKPTSALPLNHATDEKSAWRNAKIMPFGSIN